MSTGTAAVTGGASGIGEACARRLARDGHAVAVIDVNAERGEAVAGEIAAGGAQARFYGADVTNADVMEELAARIDADLGPVDTVVASAGILENASSIMDMDMAHHDRVWQVNYNGTVHTCRAFGRRMAQRRRGAIVTLGSINSYAALPLPAYCPGKTAILRLTQILAVELGRHGVRVNSVGPTYTLTPALQARIDAGERDVEVIRDSGALDLLVEPRHIADVVAFLCSEAAAAVTGATLPVDAGYLAAVSYKSYAGGVPWARLT